jgi:hypothetical protein
MNITLVAFLYVYFLLLCVIIEVATALQLRDDSAQNVIPTANELGTGGNTDPEIDMPMITAPFDHPALHFVSVCGSQGEIWVDLMKHFLSPGDVLFDLTAGFGLAFIPLAKHLSKNGSAIAFERNETVLQYLHGNVGNVGIWDRVLFLPDFPSVGADGKVSNESTALFQRAYLEMMRLLGQRCPHVVIFREHGDPNQGVDSIFARLPALLDVCQPVLHFDFHTDETKALVEKLFHQYASYNWYLESLCCLPTDGPLPNRYGILAVPKATLGRSDFSKLFKQYRLIPFINRDRFHSLFHMACDPIHTDAAFVEANAAHDDVADSSLASITTSSSTSYFGKIVVDLDMLINPFTAIACVVDFLKFSPQHSKVWEHHRMLQQALYEDAHDDYIGMMTTSCQIWILQFFNVLATIKNDIPGCHEVYSSFQQDIADMTSACIDFASERIAFLYKLHGKRIEAKAHMTPSSAYPDLQTDDLIRRTLQHSQYYPFSEFTSLTSWFERLPFENNYHPDRCAEPVFCNQSLEFLKMIRQWQYPPKTHEEAQELYLKEAQQSTLNLTRNQYQPALRSCEDAKFLVYEVASHAHGLGAMFGLIATAMRYAICHNRILILNVVGQESSLLKWRPSGCKGATFECYFEPLSHCTVSKELLRSAHVSVDGEGFDQYPLRDYKVLVLKGLPTRGPCTVCFEGMPKDLPFFDGYYIASYNPPTDAHRKQFVNMNAYLSSIKLPWISQFMRYFIRPRPWLVEAIREIVMSSMVSPAPPSNKSEGDDAVNKAVTTFPEHFLSMHVRHGMKMIEVDLVSPTRYMNFIKSKFPLIKDVFVSTETEYIIHELTRLYPDYRFHFLHYDRVQILNVRAGKHDNNATMTDYVSEMLYSMANLYVAVEADGFVGTLSSSWCLAIEYLERTRGDGGLDYYSMDRGSAFSSCF